PRFAGAVAVPGAVESEVRAQLETAVELDEQVLARGVDGIDLLADDPRNLGARQPRTGAGDDAPGQVWPQRDGDSCERVPFRHQAIIADARDFRRTNPRYPWMKPDLSRDSEWGERPAGSPSIFAMTSSRRAGSLRRVGSAPSAALAT